MGPPPKKKSFFLQKVAQCPYLQRQKKNNLLFYAKYCIIIISIRGGPLTPTAAGEDRVKIVADHLKKVWTLPPTHHFHHKLFNVPSLSTTLNPILWGGGNKKFIQMFKDIGEK